MLLFYIGYRYIHKPKQKEKYNENRTHNSNDR